MMNLVVTSPIPPIVVGIPLISVILVFFAGQKSEELRDRLVIGATGITLLLVASMLPNSLRGVIFNAYLFRMTPLIWMHFRTDQLGLLFGLTVATLWFLAAIYSLAYMRDEHAKTRYYCFLLLCLTWTLGLAFAGNLFTFFIFYELFSFSTYPLIIHEQTREALSAGKKYIIYILIGGAFVLFGIVSTYYLAGSETLAKTGILPIKYDFKILRLLFWCFIAGFGVKAAIMPLHGWVPDAHPAAPSPFSALLSGVMVTAGAFGILRVIYNVFGTILVRQLGVGLPLGYLASITIIVASIIALDQDNLKRRLAYSTIGQMSYIVLGASLLTPEGAWGSMIHIANQAFMKGTMFLCAGIIIKQTGKRNISEMQGIGSQLPLTMGAFTIAALGMIGTPPLSGFVSKWLLGIGSLAADKPIFIVVLLISALLNAAYFLPIIYIAFFGEAHEEEALPAAETEVNWQVIPTKTEASWLMLAPIIIGSMLVVIHGLVAAAPPLPLSLAQVAVRFLLK